MAPFQAYVFEGFGDDATQQLKLRKDLKFLPLKPTQVRIEVSAAGINPIDWKLIEFGGKFLTASPTTRNPFRVGFDVSGEIVQVGCEVQRLRVGDFVFGSSDFASTGTVAEYVDLEERFVAYKPATLSFNEAATVPLAALTSYQALTVFGNLQKGQNVLILGASGGTGMFGVQLALALGAGKVTATTSFRNVDFVRSLGAQQVVDYTKEKWSDLLAPHSVDLIYDCGVEPASWNDAAQKILKPGTGRFVTIEWNGPTPIISPIGATYHQVRYTPSAQDLAVIADFIERGRISVHLDSVFPFERLAEAMQRIKTGRVVGKVVVEVRKP